MLNVIKFLKILPLHECSRFEKNALDAHNNMRILYAHSNLKVEADMQGIFDGTAPKKPTNLSINSHLLQKARELKINLSATLEEALLQIVKEKQKEQWLEANRKSIEEYNTHVEQNGVFSSEFRRF